MKYNPSIRNELKLVLVCIIASLFCLSISITLYFSYTRYNIEDANESTKENCTTIDIRKISYNCCFTSCPRTKGCAPNCGICSLFSVKIDVSGDVITKKIDCKLSDSCEKDVYKRYNGTYDCWINGDEIFLSEPEYDVFIILLTFFFAFLYVAITTFAIVFMIYQTYYKNQWDFSEEPIPDAGYFATFELQN